MEKRNPTQHRMTRRAAAHDYTRPGVYHITLHVADSLGQPFGAVVGDLSAPDGSANAPHVALSPVGQVVEHELLTAIHERYPMIHVQDYVVMPEHLHFLVEVTGIIISRNGKTMPLGQVIAGFKKGCNKRYWEMTAMTAGGETEIRAGGQTEIRAGGQTAAHTVPSGFPAGNAAPLAASLAAPPAAPSGAPPAASPIASSAASPAAPSGSVPGGYPAGYKVPSNSTTGRPPLFDAGYCDVMPIDAAQLATQRAYIAGNPRSRLLRSSNRVWLSTRRGGIDTALSLSALRGYLERECPASQVTADVLAAIESQLLTAPAKSGGQTAAPTAPSGSLAGVAASAAAARFIACDSFGNRALLTERRCLPVVCHRKDAARFATQKARCLDEAAKGAVLVSARISPKEREIIEESVHHGFAVILIHDNGFADHYHPSAAHLDLCSAGRLLIITPWHYHYRPKTEAITVAACKTMNCVAQALCRTKDSWWKEPACPSVSPQV